MGDPNFEVCFVTAVQSLRAKISSFSLSAIFTFLSKLVI